MGHGGIQHWRANARQALKKRWLRTRLIDYRCSVPGLAGFINVPSPAAITVYFFGRWVAERRVEPAVPFDTRFPIVHLRPLGHLSMREGLWGPRLCRVVTVGFAREGIEPRYLAGTPDFESGAFDQLCHLQRRGADLLHRHEFFVGVRSAKRIARSSAAHSSARTPSTTCTR